jgi:hypothetical protein
MAGWLVRKLQEEEARSPGSWRELLRAIVVAEGTDQPPEELKQISTVTEAIDLIEGFIPSYDELAGLSALPNDQFAAQYAAFKEKGSAAHPLARLLMPAIDKVRSKIPSERDRLNTSGWTRALSFARN